MNNNIVPATGHYPQALVGCPFGQSPPKQILSREADRVQGHNPSTGPSKHLTGKCLTVGHARTHIEYRGVAARRMLSERGTTHSPASAAVLQEAVLADLLGVEESHELFTDMQPMAVQNLLRHAMAKVVSDGIINSVQVHPGSKGTSASIGTHSGRNATLFKVL